MNLNYIITYNSMQATAGSILCSPVEVNDILVNALKHLVKSGEDLKMVVTELLVTILQLL